MPERRASLLDSVRHVLIVHAHPDDEALAGGALLRELHERGAKVTLVTCTRGELGEIVAGVLPADTSVADLADVRERELRGSLDALGIDQHRWLGTPPARAAGLESREYRDSGMRWLRPGLAGPADDTDLRAFSVAPIEEVTTDLAAVIAHDEPDLVVSYDATGGYGHPDHVRAREASLAAAQGAGVRFAELVEQSERDLAAEIGDLEWFDLEQHRDAVVAALRSHRTQLTVDDDGSALVHSGGQRQDVHLAIGLREVVA
ncbi:PIG-L deacetylase family protein [Pseudoclavibacter terrae]|uniref:GlcNAc-PI de-N-acetylase n=1 Tax=Pseudoclavibacter terrae TaxID=1530195 RepID=A0A7J5AZX2_9MICO|nr:PIG-L family deacetylase [Pseudoclavibacter terrae]KAB1637157.1 GlcNAc-PI de-N-acetylase [Pseudoclavibacter terrae]